MILRKIYLEPIGPISSAFHGKDITDFSDACLWVKNLPYKRNADKENILCIFNDHGGTCSTKHALLKKLADELNLAGIKLMLGIFMMNSDNTKKIAKVLLKYGLKEIPEAHNYLRINDEILDFTRKGSSPEDFLNDLVEEIEIESDQITTFKIIFHKNFIKNYLSQNPQIPYTEVEFWNIREECIAALQK